MYGIIGEKLSHTKSPQIHQLIFNQLNIIADYNKFELSATELKDFILQKKYSGLNITIPYKVDVLEYMDFIAEEAKEIGAINTIYNDNGQLHGYNTDYYGFAKTLEKNKVSVKNKTVVVLGTGGASKAVMTYLKKENAAKVFLVTRDKKNYPTTTSPNITVVDYHDLEQNIHGDIIINCTPVGMSPQSNNSPVSEKCIAQFSVAMDLIYNPAETLFLKYARENSRLAINGLYMLVAQAVVAEEIWQKTTLDHAQIDIITKEIESGL